MVGRYEILREIGHGGSAVVYLARQTDLGRLVALKVLSLPRDGDGAAARRFVRESRLVAALNHPNVVTVHDFFERGGSPYVQAGVGVVVRVEEAVRDRSHRLLQV